ncbi:FMC1 protein family [Ceratocystis lukuohia]|uniref:ATP synthase assembly factor FMC1 mitochondrial n=2 Tax=Ceratocystis TaxID=5157 RepID=A0A0F8CSF3_CERFI|nr:ATP synthase assembly factor FMC1 mitochondrial [Ceratocystis platani]
MASAARSRSIYRSLLRELPPRPLLATPRTPVHQMIRERISAGAAKDSKGAQAAMAEAEAAQVVAYLQAQREYVTLIERYNPGMVMDTEERVRLTARKVGMDLPKEFK